MNSEGKGDEELFIGFFVTYWQNGKEPKHIALMAYVVLYIFFKMLKLVETFVTVKGLTLIWLQRKYYRAKQIERESELR